MLVKMGKWGANATRAQHPPPPPPWMGFSGTSGIDANLRRSARRMALA
jgi:hypothetical protein